MQAEDFTVNVPKLLTIKQFIEMGLYPNEGGIRAIIFNCEKNGFNKVIKRINSRVFIDVQAFYTWVEEQNQQVGGIK